MDLDLMQVRVISFLYGLGTLLLGAVVTGVLSFFSGPEFNALVTQHFGEGAVASLIFLIVQQVLAHVRNLAVVAKYTTQLGSADGPVSKPTLI